jgi:hypothetical protein
VIIRAHPLTLSHLILFDHSNNILREENNIVAHLLKARTMEPEKQQFLGNCCVKNKLLVSVLSVRSVPRIYNEDQRSLRESTETAVRRVGGWCEMAASLRVREPGSRVTFTVGRCHHAAQWRPWLRTLVFVWHWSARWSHELYKCAIKPVINLNSVCN